MKFNARQWVTDIATGTLSGITLAVVGHMLVPVLDVAQALWVGGTLGFVSALIAEPGKWLLELRPDGNDDVAAPKDKDG